MRRFRSGAHVMEDAVELVLLDYPEPDPLYQILMGYRLVGVALDGGEVARVSELPLQTSCARDSAEPRYTYTVKLFRSEPSVVGRWFGYKTTYFVTVKSESAEFGKEKLHYFSQDGGRTWGQARKVPPSAEQFSRLDAATEPLEMTDDEFYERHG